MNIILLRGVIVMKIKAQTDNRISIELTKNDMEQLGITYDELDYSNIETRRVLWTLLDEAGHSLGKSISLADKMMIEAVPDSAGGCVLYFTVIDKKAAAGEVIQPRTVCQSSIIDNISALARVLHKGGCVSHSELYSNGKAYRLVIFSRNTYTEKIRSIASEYTEILSNCASAATDEHWKKLASPDAVGILSALS